MTELRRITRPLSTESLLAALNGEPLPTDGLGIEADLRFVENSIASLSVPPGRSQATVDQSLVEPVFSALADLDRRTATDVGLWHWLAVGPLRSLVWLRWHTDIPQPGTVSAKQAERLAERFLGAASYRGLTHNAVGRLYWTVRFLAGDDAPTAETFGLARTVLGDTDLHAGIFDREFCAYPPAARALTRVLTSVPGTTPGGINTTPEGLREYWRGRGESRNAAETTKRRLLRRLNHRFAGMILESLDDDELQDIIETELRRLLGM